MAADELDLAFVNPNEEANRFRTVLWAPPGFGKSTAAATAPGPILAITCDRPGAWRYARKTQPGKDIREVRFEGLVTLSKVYRYLREHKGEIQTVVLDPFAQILERVGDEIPRRSDGDPDYQAINKKMVGFIHSLREFDVHVVICAHEKLNDGKKGDGKMYPSLGGASLINRVMAEMDIVASLQPEYDEESGEIVKVVGALRPAGNLVNKEGTGAQLPARMEVDLTAWFDMVTAALKPDESDLPFSEDFKGAAAGHIATPEDDPEDPVNPFAIDDARAEAAA